jgi:hypothetical protein
MAGRDESPSVRYSREMNTPVVFIVFNRPGLTRQVFSAIRVARPRLLLVVADGPRCDRPGEAERCAEVRAIVEAGVDWPCEVRRNYAETNMGCARRVATGLDWVFTQVEEAVILEDDCLPDASFFPFCEELLARYRGDPRVALVAGCDFCPSERVPANASYRFSRYLHCWGWATWAKVWRRYPDAQGMSAWRSGEGACWLTARPWTKAERGWWQQAWDETAAGRIDTWDFPFVLPWMMQGAMGVVANGNLVQNLGFGADATHTQGPAPEWARREVTEMRWPLRHPEQVVPDEIADEWVSRHQFRRWTLWARLWQRIARFSVCPAKLFTSS